MLHKMVILAKTHFVEARHKWVMVLLLIIYASRLLLSRIVMYAQTVFLILNKSSPDASGGFIANNVYPDLKKSDQGPYCLFL